MPLLSIYLVYRKIYKFVYIGISITKDNIPVGTRNVAADAVVDVDVTRRDHVPRIVVDFPCPAILAPVGIRDIAAAVVDVDDDTRRSHVPCVVGVARARRS